MGINQLSRNKNISTEIFTSNGTFTVPAGVNQIWVTLAGGGGSGGGGGNASVYSGSGGGGGQLWQRVPFKVVPGTAYAVTIGAGGVGPAGVNSTTPTAGASGSLSSFGSILTAVGGQPAGVRSGGSGRPGSGGGGRGFVILETITSGAAPSSPDANQGGLGAGMEGVATNGRNGNPSTAFVNNSTGGGGGGGGSFGPGGQGAAYIQDSGNSASPNTGGGGGGGAANSGAAGGNGGNGGSGICIVEYEV